MILGEIMGALRGECLRKTLARVLRFPGGYRQTSWSSRGNVRSLRCVLTNSWSHSAVALGTALGSFAKFLGNFGQRLGSFLGECLGKSV